MKRYILFAHPINEANGGWNDLLHEFNKPPTTEEINEQIKWKYGEKTNIEYQIIDINKSKIIETGTYAPAGIPYDKWRTP